MARLMARPGPRNLITDVDGLRVGNAEDERARTGVTVILPSTRAVCSVDVRGGAPGTRETDALSGFGLVNAVNSLGSVLMPGGRTFWAWPFEQGNEFGGAALEAAARVSDFPADTKFGALPPRAHTTLCVVATDAALDSAQARRLAVMAHDGLARAIRPAHTPFDGDVVFALSTGARPLAEPRAVTLAVLGTLAADCLARAIARGVYEATAEDALPAYRTTRFRSC
jgi:L-aminopeptidase/D-esterase-like protein